MISFSSDYVNGAHPDVLAKLVETNDEVLSTYGFDKYSASAAQKIKDACDAPEADVFFLVGGTQTNSVVISSILDDYEGVIAAKTGHVSCHEAGAIEYTGHKVIELEGKDGKLEAETVKNYLQTFHDDENHDHMVFPGMVYISYPTEYGTIYSKKELGDLYDVCNSFEIPLFIDGARLGYGLASDECDMTLAEFAHLCDIFYIGGTKVGALCGEAVVFTYGAENLHMLTRIKQHGALLAKGRLVGVQFDALFTDDLYMKIGRHAIDMAQKVKKLFADKGYKFFITSPTNQQFIILPNDKMKALANEVEFSFWEKYDEDNTVVRFATSWSTTQGDIDALEKLL